ncbi:MAG: outer membrane beta-barrel protein [Ignavibacteriales bacterium]|nr:outer membrane beta-barrel protein [Ignavibacteriales bacterium]
MKKILYVIVLLPSLAFAQMDVGAVKLGYFDPSATEGGFIIGYEGGWFVDDNFSFGWSADWFHKKYTDRQLVKEYNDFYGPIYSELNELRAKTNLHSIPLMFTINANVPISPRARAFFTGGAGLEVLLIFYRNYEKPEDDEFQGAFDFSWRLGGGILYELGERSNVFVELAYHSSRPSWEYEVKDKITNRTKILERSFDMSGMMMRVGFRFFL